MSEYAGNLLVACAGFRVDPSCAQAIDLLGSRQNTRCDFVMEEWLSEDQLSRAALLWIVDASAPWDTVYFALRNRIPLLVPEGNTMMKQLCLIAGCGLFFSNAAEAALCLEVILANDSLRSRLGASGEVYVTTSRRKIPMVAPP